MKKYSSNRLATFTEQEQNIVEAFIDLYGHYRFENAKEGSEVKGKYRQFSTGMTFREKEEKFSKKFLETTNKYAGVALDSTFSEARIRSNPQVQWASFALIGEMIDSVVPQTVLDTFYRFAEIKSTGWGDNLIFNLPNNDLFIVTQTSNANGRGDRQRLHGTDVTLTAVNHDVTLGEDAIRILAGKVNWGEWISRIAQSIETQITVEVYNAMIGNYSSLSSSYKETGAFDKTRFNNLVQRVEGGNRNLSATTFGTKVALANVLTDNQYLLFGLGEEYNKMGFLPNFQGTPLFMFEQRLTPNTDNFAISDNYLTILSTGLEKIVKIGFEGETIIREVQSNQSADRGVTYNLQKKWITGVVTAAKMGMWKFA